MNIDWTWLIVGIVLGMWVLPMLMALLNGRKSKPVAAA